MLNITKGVWSYVIGAANQIQQISNGVTIYNSKTVQLFKQQYFV